jgi:3-deoxy-7-phosphoheptulonate synthase / chorismate mutase
MAVVHPDPAVALSDAQQQMILDLFNTFYSELLASNFVRV